MNITVKDVPQELHERLGEAADESGRSLNTLTIYTLKQSFGPRRIEAYSDTTNTSGKVSRKHEKFFQ